MTILFTYKELLQNALKVWYISVFSSIYLKYVYTMVFSRSDEVSKTIIAFFRLREGFFLPAVQ